MKQMIVYHGTGDYSVESILNKGLHRKSYPHVSRLCACTSSDFRAAALFAMRKTSTDAFLAGKVTGVVVEFELSGTTRDFRPVNNNSLQEEHEIAVFNVKCLKPIAIWRHDGDWKRQPYNGGDGGGVLLDLPTRTEAVSCGSRLDG